MRQRICAIAIVLAASSLHAATTTYSLSQPTYNFVEGETRNITVLRGGDTSAGETLLTLVDLGNLPYVQGSITFAPNETSKSFTISLPNDNTYNDPILGNVWIYDNPVHIVASSKLVIADDDPMPTLTQVGPPIAVAEGNSGTTSVVLHFHLSNPFTFVEDTYVSAFESSSVPNPIDFTKTFTTIYAPMTLHQQDFNVTVSFHGDTIPEADEHVTVTFRIANVSVNGGFTILNDEYLLSQDSLQLERGKNGSLTISTSVPSATTDHIELSSSDPKVATVPPSIDIPAGATSATIPITTLSIGSAIIGAKAPPSRGGVTVGATVAVYDVNTFSFDHNGINLNLGANAVVTAHIVPPPDAPFQVALTNSNSSVANVPSSFTMGVDGSGTFTVHGNAVGFASITATLPTEHGGTAFGVAVNVIQPSGLSITNLGTKSGPATGNQPITISGTNMSGRCTVTFGGASALNTANAASGSITTYTPPHAAGIVDVAIRCGNDSFTLANGYTYTPAPARITGISPATGSAAGGTIVTVNGENLPRGRCALWIGDAPATTLTNLQTTEMTAITPASVPGVVSLALRCGGDVSALNDAFVYTSSEDPVATIAAANPSTAAPGERVAIGGAHFRLSDLISFGNAAALDVSTTSTQHFVTVPDLPPGNVILTIRDANGHTIAGPSFAIKASAAAQITSAPATTPSGAELVVNGNGFRPSFSFFLGDAPLRTVALTSAYAVLHVPANAQPRATTLAIHDAEGSTVASRAMEVTSTGVAVDSVSPQCISTDGNVLITISGSGFESGAVVTFGIADATDVVVRDAHTIIARAPASSGSTDATVTVTNPSLQTAQLTDGVQYRWPDSACGGKHRSARH
jgi:hypothetical protein